MVSPGLLRVLVAVSLAACVYGNYFIACPNTFRPEIDFSCEVSYVGAEAVNVEVKLGIPGEPPLSSRTLPLENGRRHISITIPTVVPDGTYNLTVVGRAAADSRELFRNSTILQDESDTSLLFIQIDKPIYKPLQTVKFRVVCVDQDLKPRTVPTDISIFDKNDNKLEEWLAVSGQNGVIEKSYKLSDLPPLGEWKIKARNNIAMAEKDFSVDKYVLPKFEVTAEADPKFLITGDGGNDDFTVKVKAKFTYGKDVPGKATFIFGEQQIITESAILNYDAEGFHKQQFKLSEFDKVKTWNGLKFSVNVTEDATRVNESSNQVTILLHNRRTKMEFLPSSDQVFRPGQEVKFQLKVKDIVDNIPAHVDSTVVITAYMGGKSVNQSLQVDRQGMVSASFVIPATETRDYGIQFTATLKVSSYTLREYHTVLPYRTKLNTTVEVDIPTSQPIGSGGSFDIEITTNVRGTAQITRMGYMVLARGVVVDSGPIQMIGSSKTHTIASSRWMSPQAHVVVYGIVTDGKMYEVISDYEDVQVEGVFDNTVSLEFSSDNSRAGTDVDITVRSTANSKYYILAVDKSVLLLGTGNDLSQADVTNRIGKFSLDKTRSYTDGPEPHVGGADAFIMPRPGPGGSTNDAPTSAGQIFTELGLVYLSALSIETDLPPPDLVYYDYAVEFDMMGKGNIGLVYLSDIIVATAPPPREFPIMAMAGAGGGDIRRKDDLDALAVPRLWNLESVQKIGLVILSGAIVEKAPPPRQIFPMMAFADGGGAVAFSNTDILTNYNKVHPKTFVIAVNVIAVNSEQRGLVYMTDVIVEDSPSRNRWPIDAIQDGAIMFKGANGPATLTGTRIQLLRPARPSRVTALLVPSPTQTGQAVATAESAVDSPAATGTKTQFAEVGSVRKSFPEAWLWMDGMVDSNGVLTFTKKVPDTITEWQATAFAMSDTRGLAISQAPAKMTSFQPFFASMTLPYAMQRGEITELRVTINNYIVPEQSTIVKVTLKQSSDFSVLEDANGEKVLVSKDIVRELTVKPNIPGLVIFKIKPTILGQVGINVVAQPEQSTGEKGDSLIRKVLVKPEGFVRRVVEGRTVELDVGDDAFTSNVSITFPDNVVPDSKRIEVKVTGDVMGPTVDGLEHLIQMPTGCGEQNMITLVPNIVVYNYLKTVNRLTTDIEDRAIANMKAGYQRELQYLRKDHSFSAFGDSDPSGSTWLTAFVMKCFSMAKNEITVDANMMKRAFTFVKSSQEDDGTFSLRGRVIHSEMLGGTSGANQSLTAFIFIALKESETFLSLADEPAIAKAKKYLEDQVSAGLVTSTYEMAIVAYALTLADSSMATILLDKLKSTGPTLAALSIPAITRVKGQFNQEEEGGYPQCTWPSSWWSPKDWFHFDYTKKPWDRPTTDEPNPPEGQGNKRAMIYHPPKATSSDVETWAYVLMAHAERQEIVDGRPIMKWLLSQQNGQGGFYSSKDTVLALQALAEYAAKVYAAPQTDITLNVRSNKESHQFKVQLNQLLLLQSYKFTYPDDTTFVELSATGRGLALVKILYQYNTMKEPQKPTTDTKVISQVLTEKINEKLFRARTCVKSSENKGMLIVTMGMQTEMSVSNIEQLEKDPNIKRVDYDENDLHIYYEAGLPDFQCSDVQLQQDAPVINRKPASFKAYFYYSPEYETEGMYTVSEAKPLIDICKMCEGNACPRDCDKCKHCGSNCPSDCDTSGAKTWKYDGMMLAMAICFLLSLIMAM